MGIPLLSVVAPPMVGVSSAAGSNPPFEPDGNAAPPYGNLTLYNAAGQEVTGGTNLNSPFAYVVANTAADTNADQATVNFFNPQPGTPPLPANWTGTYEAGPTTFSPSSSLPGGTPADIVADAPTHAVVATSSADINTWLSANTPSTTAGYADTIQVRLTDSGPVGAGNAAGTYWETDIAYNNTASTIQVDGNSLPPNTWLELFPLVSPSTTSLAASPASPQGTGTNVTLTATVTPSTAAGVVQFWDGTTSLGAPVTVASGAASTTITPAAGSHSYTADFVPNEGDETFPNTNKATIIGGSASNTVPYTISNVKVTKFSPTPLGEGATSVPVTITGADFVSGATVAASGVTFSSVTVASSTSITAKATVSSTAKTGADTVTVTDSQGPGTCANCLTIVAAPKLTKFSPSKLGQGAGGAIVTLTGSGFVSGVTLAATGITFSSVKEVSSTSITAKATVSSTQKTGADPVTVIMPAASGSGRGSCATCLSIIAGPKLTKFTPSKLGQGASNIAVTVTGSGFVSGVTLLASGITFSSVKEVSSTSITARASVSSTAKTGAETVTVIMPAASGSGRGSCATCLTIATGPKVTKFTPNKLTQKQSNVSITVTGSGFVAGAVLSVSGVTFSTVKVTSTSITAKATVASTAKVGAATVTVTDPASSGSGRGSCTTCLTIAAAAGPRAIRLATFSRINVVGYTRISAL